MYYEDNARRMNVLTGFIIGTLVGIAGTMIALADIRLRRRPTFRERVEGWGADTRDRAAAAAADTVAALTDSAKSAPARVKERLRG